MTVAARLLGLVRRHPGIALAEAARRLGVRYQHLRQVVRLLQKKGILHRRKEDVYRLYLAGQKGDVNHRDRVPISQAVEDEDGVKRILARYFEERGFQVMARYGRAQGPDLLARRGDEQLVVEVKGLGKYSPMRVNFFLAALGEILTRMSDPSVRYAVAFPDHPQYRRLWSRLPTWVKERLGLNAFFVGEGVEEVG